MVKVKPQQESQLQNSTKLKAKSKSNPKPVIEIIERPKVMTVLKDKSSLIHPRKTLKKRKPMKKLEQPIQRSLLMSNALMPLMPVTIRKNAQKKVFGEQLKIEPLRRRVAGNGTKALLVLRDSLERIGRQKKQAKKSSRRKLEPTKTGKTAKRVNHNQPEVFSDKGQCLTLPLPFKNSTKAAGRVEDLTSTAGIVKHNKNSTQQNQTQNPHLNQKKKDMVVPLTNRLPIIDFISTDDFARMHATKKQKAARRLALGNDANE